MRKPISVRIIHLVYCEWIDLNYHSATLANEMNFGKVKKTFLFLLLRRSVETLKKTKSGFLYVWMTIDDGTVHSTEAANFHAKPSPTRFHRNQQKCFDIVKRNIISVVSSSPSQPREYQFKESVFLSKLELHSEGRERGREAYLHSKQATSCHSIALFHRIIRAEFAFFPSLTIFFYLRILMSSSYSMCSSLLCALHKETIRGEFFFLWQGYKGNQMWFFSITLTRNGPFGNSNELCAIAFFWQPYFFLLFLLFWTLFN